MANEAGKVHLKNIDLAALRLNGLIGDILDVAKLQEGRMSFSSISMNPNDIIANVVEGYQQPAKVKQLALLSTYEGDVNINADPERFRQVVVNLVGNAVKYTAHGEVQVHTKKENGNFILRVSDSGMGISAEHQKRLFEKFYRVKTEATSRIEGTGLGLWITRSIVERMGGTISVESIEGKGSDFIVSFRTLE